MAQYSIKELEHLSGIKAHTIRIWEQRYRILSPKRTETNIRYYDDADLKTILNISVLNEHGYKISKIAQMLHQELAEAVEQLSQQRVPNSQRLNALLLAMIEMDEERFDRLLTTIIIQKGLEQTMLEVICPLLIKVGILWQTGSIRPAQEHFVSNIIRQKLFVAIDGQVPVSRVASTRFLLFLPEGELHEIGILFSYYILRKRGHHVLYLGQHLPLSDVETTVQSYQPHYICTAFTVIPERDQVQKYIRHLAELAPDVIIFVGGQQAQHQELIFPENLVRVSTLPHFIELIDKQNKQ
ncbi:MAG: helix-turn-helix-type transcriptional regulator [Cytophagales bacterium CG18_big_fil_WC_8_21_14_2_50_42_9]|nr:MAG: helix-turn-helix-type transcriptional regulator [Cytophagales bacterium CG18_big_fil_WC_8_21_14_2_50_42_9]